MLVLFLLLLCSRELFFFTSQCGERESVGGEGVCVVSCISLFYFCVCVHMSGDRSVPLHCSIYTEVGSVTSQCVVEKVCSIMHSFLLPCVCRELMLSNYESVRLCVCLERGRVLVPSLLLLCVDNWVPFSL